MTRRANILVEAIVKSTTAGRGFSVVIKVRFALFSMNLSAKFGPVLMEHEQQTSEALSPYSSLSGGS